MKAEKTEIRLVCDGAGCANLAAWRIEGLNETVYLCDACEKKLASCLARAGEREHVGKKR